MWAIPRGREGTRSCTIGYSIMFGEPKYVFKSISRHVCHSSNGFPVRPHLVTSGRQRWLADHRLQRPLIGQKISHVTAFTRQTNCLKSSWCTPIALSLVCDCHVTTTRDYPRDNCVIINYNAIDKFLSRALTLYSINRIVSLQIRQCLLVNTWLMLHL